MESRILWISAQSDLPAGWPHHPALWNIEILPPEEASYALESAGYAAIVLDLPLPGWNTPTLLEDLQRKAPGIPVLARDPNVSVSEAVALAHLGVYQVLPEGENAFH